MQENIEAQKVPARALLIILVVVALSLTAIMSANYILGHPEIPASQDLALYLLILGAVGLILSIYILLQLRRRIVRARIESPPIVTVVECKACGYKNSRAFQRGDYIFKEGEACDKCKGKTLITAIYREVKDKERDTFPT
jgi:hypothetical protein